MKKLWILLILFGFFCGGGAYIINKEAENVKLSYVGTDQLMLSSTEIRLTEKGKRLVYKKWFFTKADEKGVYFRYEESFDANKTTPDVTEVKFYPLVNDTLELPGYVVYIYKLKEDYIAYTMEAQIQ